jgi:hypothetical protein
VQPSNATPNVRVAAFAASATRITPGRSSPSSAAALAQHEDREITRDTTPFRFFTLRCAGDIVGDAK